MDGHDLTRLLQQWRAGDKAAEEAAMDFIYSELKKLVHAQHVREPGFSRQTTEWVNELYLRLAVRGSDLPEWENRKHFYGVAARQMRQILVDEARRKKAGKRGSGLANLPLDIDFHLGDGKHADVLALEDALQGLAQENGDAACVVDLRFFVGMNYEEIAAVLGISEGTVRRRWKLARNWLLLKLRGANGL